MIIFGQHGMNKYTRNVIGYSYLLTTIKPMLSVQRVCETFEPFQHYLRNVVLFFWLLREMWVQMIRLHMSPTAKLHFFYK